MKFFLMAIAYMGLLGVGRAQDSTVLEIWPHEVPAAKGPKQAPRVTPDEHGHITRLTDVTNPTLTVFTPPADHASGAAVVVCPGGGYQILAIDLEGYEIAHWLNSLGITAFVLQYRVPGQRDAALQDLQRALRLIRSQADQWHIDPQRLGVMGFSAGGSLSARVSTLAGRNTYTPVDEADKAADLPSFALLIYPAYLDKGRGDTLTPELHVEERTPPMFIFQTADDPYGHSALVMAAALRAHKVPVELHLYPKGGHGYGLRPGNPAGETWPALAARWLEQFATPSSH